MPSPAARVGEKGRKRREWAGTRRPGGIYLKTSITGLDRQVQRALVPEPGHKLGKGLAAIEDCPLAPEFADRAAEQHTTGGVVDEVAGMK